MTSNTRMKHHIMWGEEKPAGIHRALFKFHFLTLLLLLLLLLLYKDNFIVQGK